MQQTPPEQVSHLSLVHEPAETRRAQFSVADYLQLARAGRRSVCVRVQGLGEVLVVDGALWQARDHLGAGYPALMRILLGGGLQASCPAECFGLEGPTGPRRIETEIDRAILEAARIMDEEGDKLENGASEEDPGPFESLLETDVLSVEDEAGSQLALAGQPLDDPDDTLESLDEMFEAVDRGLNHLLDRDYGAAYRAFREAHEMGDESSLVVGNLERLESLGYGLTESENGEEEDDVPPSGGAL